MATRHAATGRGGRLNVGAVTSAFAWPLPEAIERFHAAMPDIDIRAQEIDSHEAAGLLDRTLDLVVVRQTAPVHGTTAVWLFTDQFVVALPADDPTAGTSESMGLATLAGDTWIWLHREISPDYHDAIAALCRVAGFSPIRAHWARSVTSQIAMVECGLGVTSVPSAAAAPHHAARFRTLRDGAATIGLTIMTRHDPDEPVRRFTALTTDVASQR